MIMLCYKLTYIISNVDAITTKCLWTWKRVVSWVSQSGLFGTKFPRNGFFYIWFLIWRCRRSFVLILFVKLLFILNWNTLLRWDDGDFSFLLQENFISTEYLQSLQKMFSKENVIEEGILVWSIFLAIWVSYISMLALDS